MFCTSFLIKGMRALCSFPPSKPHRPKTPTLRPLHLRLFLRLHDAQTRLCSNIQAARHFPPKPAPCLPGRHCKYFIYYAIRHNRYAPPSRSPWPTSFLPRNGAYPMEGATTTAAAGVTKASLTPNPPSALPLLARPPSCPPPHL